MIDRVTITGADNSISSTQLAGLSREFPFVEWGILVSKSSTGKWPRYPTEPWIGYLLAIADKYPMNLSLHLCGRWVRDLLLGTNSIPDFLLAPAITGRASFDRVQLNFHAERSECRPQAFAERLKSIGKPFIFQLDGANGNKHLDSANEWEVPHCHGLFDVSGGAGILPSEWPKPIYLDAGLDDEGGCIEQHAYHGYAGGLGPENLAEQIPLILAAAAGTEHTQEGHIWIDMETRVRSDNDQHFDLAKVRRCLEIAAPFVTPDAPERSTSGHCLLCGSPGHGASWHETP